MIHKKGIPRGNRRIVYLLPLLLAACGWSSCKHETPAGRDNAAINQERGGQIVAEYLKRDAAPYRKNRVRMTIVAPSEPQKVYELEIWRKQAPGETLTLTHVVAPAEESDLAALSIEKKGEATVNVSYVSSTGQFRETGTEKMFFGGLTAQELLGEWDKYDYTLKEEKDLNGVKTFVVEGTLKPTVSSVIAKTETLFRADTYMPAEFHLFNSAGEEVRTFQVKNYHNVSGHDLCWLTDIDNHSRKTKITIESLGVEFPAKADDAIFTREHVKQLAMKR
jgi:outer membrane lipoprotein-sorting protein